MAQLYQNRHKNAESHLFGDEPPPEHYEISPETIQGLRDANNNRKKAMESNLFSDETAKPAIQNQPQVIPANQYPGIKYQQPSYSNQKAKYQPPHLPPTQILKPKLQPLAPAPSQDDFGFRQNANQPTLLQQFRQTQDQPTQQLSPPPQQQLQRPKVPTINYSSIPNLNENLAQIDNSLPSISARKFVIEDNSPQNVDSQQSPPRTVITTHRRPTFINAQVKETALPNFNVADLVQNSQVPQLSPFPNIDFDLAPIDNNFAFVVKPLTSSGQRYPKKLNLTNAAGNEMKKMRDELEKDAQQFDSRIKRIEKVEIVQPMRPVTAVADDPPTLDFSFATPRSMWNFDRHQNLNENEQGRRSSMKNDIPDLNITNSNEMNIPNNNEYYEDNDDNNGEAGLMSTQSDFIYLDTQNLD